EMDADFSHDPSYLPRFLDAARSAELVIGSRYIPGGTTPNWSALRRFISRGGNTFSRAVLQLPVHDCTSGFRCYHRSALEAIDLDTITSQGYAFQVAMVYQVLKQGMRVAEIPITFVDRRIGKSKMSKKIFFEAFRYVVGERLRSGGVPRSSSGRVRILPPLAADPSATPVR
ncbi:MAG TPA: glycosyltransferase, partial [Ktedonobacterales bacterium]|nr:glycosyltransferase [Ktedonobacterales bacterium]